MAKKTVRKSVSSELDGLESLALDIAREEWLSEVGFEPSYGDIEYRPGSKVYTVKLTYNGEVFEDPGYWRPAPRPFPEPAPGPFPRPLPMPEPIPMPRVPSYMINAKGIFEVNVKKKEIIKEKIKIERGGRRFELV